MRLVALLLLAACGSEHAPVPPKRPNNELIIDTFERHPPLGTTAMRFRADGSVDVAHAADKLDRENLASGTWQLEKDQLTLTYSKGMCASDGPGVYRVVLSKVGLRFQEKISDNCAQRSKIAGETWWRR
jgi:hypothetical protein